MLTLRRCLAVVWLTICRWLTVVWLTVRRWLTVVWLRVRRGLAIVLFTVHRSLAVVLLTVSRSLAVVWILLVLLIENMMTDYVRGCPVGCVLCCLTCELRYCQFDRVRKRLTRLLPNSLMLLPILLVLVASPLSTQH